MNVVPVYAVANDDDSTYHIVIGTKKRSLCGFTDIIQAVQLPPTESIEEIIDADICNKCLAKEQEYNKQYFQEDTITCASCDSAYSSVRSRTVTMNSQTSVPICKVCYNKMYNNPHCDVTIPYDDAESWSEQGSVSRTFAYE